MRDHMLSTKGWLKYDPAKGVPETIETWSVEDDELTLPRGGLHRVRSILRAHHIEHVVQDNRIEASCEFPELPSTAKTPWDFQVLLVDAAIAKQNCCVRSPTASGKTSSAMQLIRRIKQRTLVVVPNKTISDVWCDRIQVELGIKAALLGGGKKTRSDAQVTVAITATIASMIKRCELTTEWLNHFGCVIGDEIQKFAAPTFSAAVESWPAKYRIGFSADETRKDRKEFLIYDVFGQVAFEVGRDELTERGFILDVQICVIPTSFEAPWYPHQDTDRNRMHREMREDPNREKLIQDIVMNEARMGQQILVLSHSRDHVWQLEKFMLEQSLRTGIMVGGVGDRLRSDATRAGLGDRTVQVCIGTTQAVGTGMDIPLLDTCVLTTPLAGNRQEFNQVRGRVCRKPEGKTKARLFYLWDRDVYGLRHLENLVAWNRVVVVMHPVTKQWHTGKEYLTMCRNGEA